MIVVESDRRTGERTDPDARSGRPYLVVSTDSHASPSLERHLRPYCPSAYLEAFDDFVTTYRTERAVADTADASGRSAYADSAALRLARIAAASSSRESAAVRLGTASPPSHPPTTRSTGRVGRDAVAAALRGSNECAGYDDPYERLRHMDEDGVAVDVIFSGGPNGEVLPFLAFGFDQGPAATPIELRQVGSRIWNDWLADYVSVAPERHVGVMQIVIADLEGSIREVKRAHARGLRAVNLPAPRSDYAPYTDPIYEPLWSVCEDLGLPFVTHVGGGEFPLGTTGPMGMQLYMSESDFMARRGLWQLIFGGVFARHPGLRIVFSEQRAAWVPDTIANLDSIYFCDLFDLDEISKVLPRPPSEYWAEHCFVGGSFLAAFEVALRDQIGVGNIMWGSDYPHMEGTWPHTRLAMRHTFAGVPEADVRRILGENALGVYGLDEEMLRPVADRIGPTPEELSNPLAPDEYPPVRSNAFRVRGAFS